MGKPAREQLRVNRAELAGVTAHVRSHERVASRVLTRARALRRQALSTANAEDSAYRTTQGHGASERHHAEPNSPALMSASVPSRQSQSYDRFREDANVELSPQRSVSEPEQNLTKCNWPTAAPEAAPPGPAGAKSSGEPEASRV